MSPNPKPVTSPIRTPPVCLHIIFYIDSVPFTRSVIDGKSSLGGSESACLSLARGLAARGHDVHIFATKLDDDGAGTDKHGVQWSPVEHLPDVMRFAPPDVFVSLRMPGVYHNPVPAKLRILWAQDLLQLSSQIDPVLFQVDQLHYVSQYHRAQWEGVSKLVSRVDSYVTDNPFDVGRAVTMSGQSVRGRYRLAHISRPERGMDAVLRYWPDIRKKYPEATLTVCRYNSMYDATGWGRVCESYDQKVAMVNQLVGGIEYAGELGKDDLYRLLGSVNALFYPTSQPGFAETNCIAVAEAQACGTPVIASYLGAIPETLKSGAGILVPGVYTDPETKAGFLAAVDRVFGDNGWSAEARAMGKTGQRLALQFDQAKVAAEWEAQVLATFEERARVNKIGLMRRFLHDDNHIHALKLAQSMVEPADECKELSEVKPGTREAWEAIALCNRVMAQEDLTADQYAQFAIQSPIGEMEINGRLQRAAQEIINHLPDLTQANNPECIDRACWNVLDVAGGNGTFALLLLTNRPDIRVTLIDFSEGVLNMARSAAQELGVADRLNVIQASPWGYKQEYPTHQFDAVFSGEFLEHVEKPHEVLDLLESMAAPGALIVLTTPCGPFAELLDPAIPRHRGHIHSFTLRELTTMLDGKEGSCEYMDMGISPWGSPVGTWLIKYIAAPLDRRVPSPPIDYGHLLLVERPYQTLTVGMIVRDAVGSIHRALDSVYRIADHILVIDTGSTDGTLDLLKQWEAKPHGKLRVVQREWPDDFSVARNWTVELAEDLAPGPGSWFMWFDSDEVLEKSQAVRLVMTDGSPFVAYALRQHHTMVDQPTFYDKPNRLFRLNRGIRFYGVVHEQPGQPGGDDQGNPPQDCPVFPSLDLASPHSPFFWHVGYQNEELRKFKMFRRNRPLLVKELKGEGTHLPRELAWAFEIRDQLNMARYADDPDVRRKCILTGLGIFEKRDMGNIKNPAHIPAREWYEQLLDLAEMGYTLLYGLNMGQGNKANPPKASRMRVRNLEDGRTRLHAWLDEQFDTRKAKPADTRPFGDIVSIDVADRVEWVRDAVASKPVDVGASEAMGTPTAANRPVLD